MYSLLFLGHAGQALEGLLVLGTEKIGKGIAGVVLAWFLFNDYLDYGMNLHTAIPDVPEKIGITAAVAILLSTSIVFSFYYGGERKVNAFSFSRELTELRKFISSGKEK